MSKTSCGILITPNNKKSAMKDKLFYSSCHVKIYKGNNNLGIT